MADDDTLAPAVDTGCVVKNKWKIGEKIASGGFGCIFKAHNIVTKETVALKTEKKAIKDYLKIESDVYKLVSGKCGFPKFLWSGKTFFVEPENGNVKLQCRILVMEILGSSLSDLFYQMNKQFSLKTVLMIAIQMIDRLADLHSVGIVHRDIKPGNFVMGTGETAHIVYLLDFGLSHWYRDPETEEHIPFQENVAFRGTHRYASIKSHFRIEQSRRDDLEALGYVLIYFLKGLPWANVQCERKDRRKVIGDAKAHTSLESLTEGLPAEFVRYLERVQGLEFSQDPPYEELKKLFHDCLKKQNHDFDYCYDWTKNPTPIEYEPRKTPSPNGKKAILPVEPQEKRRKIQENQELPETTQKPKRRAAKVDQKVIDRAEYQPPKSKRRINYEDGSESSDSLPKPKRRKPTVKRSNQENDSSEYSPKKTVKRKKIMEPIEISSD